MIFISIIDVKSGFDEDAYTEIESLTPDNGVVPLLIGRIFEDTDILLILYSDDLEAVDNYLIEYVRKSEAAQELILIPIYEFSLFPAFNSLTELSSVPNTESELAVEEIESDDDLLMVMVKIDVAPTKDKQVQEEIITIQEHEGIIPLMSGHTFHSKEFDIVLFFLAQRLEDIWNFTKYIREKDGVWDTQLGIIAHFESLVSLEKFQSYVAKK